MGFFDKVFGGKTTGGLFPEEMKDFRILENQGKGFSIIMPQDWQIVETASGLEARPAECSLVTDPASGQEVPTPRLTITLSEIANPGQNMIKETLRSRAAELKDHQLIKHHTSSVKGADNGIVYEYQYGPKESPLLFWGSSPRERTGCSSSRHPAPAVISTETDPFSKEPYSASNLSDGQEPGIR